MLGMSGGQQPSPEMLRQLAEKMPGGIPPGGLSNLPGAAGPLPGLGGKLPGLGGAPLGLPQNLGKKK
jgi:signal recognition particle subunit SRP54